MKHVEYSKGKFHIWCDVEERWVLNGVTRQEIIDYFIKVAAERAYDAAINLCKEAKPGNVH
jgi:hypothetical protein